MAAAQEKKELSIEDKIKLAGEERVLLPRNTNQAIGIGQFAIDFLAGKLGVGPDAAVAKRVIQFHTDAVCCGVSALALKTNAPTILRQEALEYPNAKGATVLGSEVRVAPEKAILANGSAVREWDSNGTVFGFNEKFGHLAGEFGHNDFYGVAVAGCQVAGYDGKMAVKAMILVDEIRGRLAEVFSLKTYKIDHVVHGAIASAAVYGALLGATAAQIESAIGMTVAHYIPYRAIRAGHQLSDSKGASAAISTEVAILSMQRALRGFVGPKDIFRNPEALFRLNQPTKGDCPFDIVLSHSGKDFSLMGMHFKMALYEHQSAGGLQAIVDALVKNPEIIKSAENIKSVKVVAYEPAFGIIGDPHKRDPHTRQSADHSMVYICSTLLKKAVELGPAKLAKNSDALWQQLVLTPFDYGGKALFDKKTRKIMEVVSFEHGGKAYDDNYPKGIPTSVIITTADGKSYDSGLVMFPAGHALNTTADLNAILTNKDRTLLSLAVKDVDGALAKLNNIENASAKELLDIYNFDLTYQFQSIDAI